jgi:hypothetical protein
VGDRYRDADALALYGRRSSARCSTGCWNGCVVGAALCWCCAGKAGIGKTALLGCLTERAAGSAWPDALGVESEMELAFTGLHDLCAPMLSPGRVGRAPASGAQRGTGSNFRGAPGVISGSTGDAEPSGAGRRGPATAVHRR